MSGSIGGHRISRADVQPTLEAYIDKVLSKFPGFQDCAITGSYNAGTKKDHGDIDLVVYINHKDLKTLKKSFKEYLEKLPDNVTIPFATGKRQGDKAQLFGSIVTCGFPIAGTSYPVQIDNILVTTRKDATFQKSFLNLDAQKQALFQGLVRVLLLHNDKDKIFKHFGLEEYPEPRPDQEYEFVLSTAGLSLRIVDLSPDYRELSRTEVWRSNDWEDVKWLLKDYNMDFTYEKLLNKVSKNIQDDRSRRRIVGIMKSMIRVGPGEVGTPKGDAKEAGIQLAKEKLNVNEGLKRYLQEALVHKHMDLKVANPFDLTKKDLIGDIAGFPMGVVVRMMEETELQNHEPDVKLFQRYRDAGNTHEGFIWSDSSYDGSKDKSENFWRRVITQEDFNLFFKQYPEYKKYNL